MPAGGEPDDLAPLIVQLRDEMAAAGKPAPEVVLLSRLPLDDRSQAKARAQAFAAIGVTRIVHGWRYTDESEFGRACDALAALDLGR